MSIDPEVLKTTAWAIIVVGVVGAVLPILPGPLLIWGGVLLWSYADHWLRPPLAVLIVLTVLTVVGESTDLWVGGVAARKGGASWVAITVGAILGIIGFFVLHIIGALLGPIVGILLVEWIRQGNLFAGIKAATAYFVGSLFSVVVQLFVGGIMIAAFWLTTQ